VTATLQQQLEDLVIANRILAREEVVDGFGHISMRHPERADRFFMSRSRSPELVVLDDIMEFDLDCNPIDQRGRSMYGERPIHGAIYQRRPDVGSVVHNHAHEVIPYSVTKVPMRQVIHTAGGADTTFRSGTSATNWRYRLLVRTLDQGTEFRALAWRQRAAPMRGHGCVVTGKRRDAVRIAVYLMVQRPPADGSHALGDVTFPKSEIVATADMAASRSRGPGVGYWAAPQRVCLAGAAKSDCRVRA
jgi:HCOMODA/2-hydroxy-3-carboxy-muconic semialdehyde decarboxylase